MLHINTTPGNKKGFSFSAGVSAGYLVGSRVKQKSAERGKQKYKGDFENLSATGKVVNVYNAVKSCQKLEATKNL